MSQFCMGCMEQFDDALEVCPHCGYVRGTKEDNAIHIEPGEVLHERYIIGRAIGWGGFGVTYIGWDALLEHKVAIKEYMPSEFSTRSMGTKEVTVFGGKKAEQFESGKQKFHEEAKKLAKFNTDDGIVRVYDSFEENQTAYIVMELLEGETLDSLLKREKKLPYEKAISIILPIAEALKTVHADGVIHRDIAPDNIFLTNDGKVKLIDFGAARFATTSHSRSLSVLIKPGYSPEEQYRSRGDQGPYTDIYALGAVLYHMITGTVPPDALERRAYFENQKKDILTPVSKYAKDVPENRQNAILNAMNVRIEDRTQSAEAFIQELTTDGPVQRRSGKIKAVDFFSWPRWAKIALPAAAAVIVICTVLLAAGVIGFRDRTQKEIIVPSGMARVPSVINTQVEDAEARLTEAVLLYAISGKTYSENVPADLILTQSIEGGAVVQQNSVLDLVISGGRETAVVPNVIGTYRDEAERILIEAGFLCRFEEEYSDAVGIGGVLKQSAEPDSELAAGEVITLTVSMGRDPSKTYEETETEVPDFTGMTYQEAMQLAQEKSLLIVAKEKACSDKFAKDTVMTQLTPAGQKVPGGSTVELTVSLGRQIVKIPDLQYKTEQDAVSAAERLGIKAEISYTESDNIRAGLVISQTPAAGTTGDSGTVMKLVVSKGAAAFAMPDVNGQQADAAQSLLSGKGLSVSIAYERSSSAPGIVLRQSVSAGTNVRAGDAVILTVSTGEELVSVPDVTGMSESEAVSLLKSKGFTVGNPNLAYSDTVEKDKVIAQSPAAGSAQKKGSDILLTVSRGREPVTVPDVVNKSKSAAESALAESGLRAECSEEYSDTVAAGAVMQQNPASGKKVTRGSTVTLVISKGKKYTVEPDINLSSNEITLYPEGDQSTYKLNVTIMPSGIPVSNISYIGGDRNVARISAAGIIKAIAPGDTEIRVRVSMMNGTLEREVVCKVHVVAKAPVRAVYTPAPGGDIYYIGESVDPDMAKLEITYNDGTSETVGSGFSYSPQVLTQPGTVDVDVLYHGEKVTTYRVTVREPEISMELKPENLEMLSGDELDLLITYAVMEHGSGLGGASAINLMSYRRYLLVDYKSTGKNPMTLTSSDPGVLRVDEEAGKLVAVSEGTARITASITEGGQQFSQSVEISVLDHYNSYQRYTVEESVQAETTDADGNTCSCLKYTYSVPMTVDLCGMSLKFYFTEDLPLYKVRLSKGFRSEEVGEMSFGEETYEGTTYRTASIRCDFLNDGMGQAALELFAAPNVLTDTHYKIIMDKQHFKIKYMNGKDASVGIVGEEYVH